MKTRRVHTKIWRDEWFVNLSTKGKLLFVYLISSEYMGLSGFAELPDRQISFDTGLSLQDIEATKKELVGKVNFYKGWVFIINLFKYDPIQGENNNLWKAYQKEVEAVPEDIKRELETPSEGLQTPSVGCNGIGNGKGIGKKEVVKEKTNKHSSLNDLGDQEFQEVSEFYKVSIQFVKSCYDSLVNYVPNKPGKPYKDYLAALRNFVKGDKGFEQAKQSYRSTVQATVIHIPTLSPDERRVAQEKVLAMKNALANKLSINTIP